jgi:uncharacterized protein DUF6049
MPRCHAPRRLAALATAVVVAVLVAAPALAATGQRGEHSRRVTPQLSLVITSVSPDFAQPKDTVTVSGTVTNPTASAMTGLSVQLWSSGTRLPGRSAMATYLSPDSSGADFEVGQPGPLFSLAPHASLQWTLTLRPGQVGMRQFGVYPLAAQLSGPLGQLARARTFLPFWPGRPEARAIKPLSIAWVWPLVDTPQQAACRAIRNGQLAASLAPGGRLNGLLAAGSSETAEQARLTWAIDPALLNDASLMTHRYRTGVSPTCTGGVTKPADPAASAWLAGVRSVSKQQNFFVTPYADVDVAALAHRGLDGNLASAFSSGQRAAAAVLRPGGQPRAGHTSAPGRAQHTTPPLAGQIAWPPGGIADYGVLEDLATNHVRTVILDSNMMPPTATVNYTPGAVATTYAPGTRLHVLLADHTIVRILTTPRNKIPGAMPAPSAGARAPAAAAAAAFAKEQWFLAETAMIAAEVPTAARSLVVMPPRRWAPPPNMAETLLSQTVQAPWLRPATLAGLATTRSLSGKLLGRQQPPPRKVSRSELKPSLLKQVRQLTGQVHLLSSILVTAGHSYLSNAIAAIESSAWRGGPANQRRAEQQLRRVAGYVHAQLQQVSIIHSLHVTLGGKSGPVPVSVSNHLDREVRVKLKVSPSTPGRIEIGPFRDVVTVPAHHQRLIKIPVRSAAAGSNTLMLQLATPDGRLLSGTPSSLTVEATHFGTLAIVIIVVALLVFVSTATGRAIRRGGEAPDGDEDGAEDLADGEYPGEEEDEGEELPDEGPPGSDGYEPGEPREPGRTPRAGTDPASAAAERDTVGAAGADALNRPKEPDDHASTPGRGRRL